MLPEDRLNEIRKSFHMEDLFNVIPFWEKHCSLQDL